MLIFPDVIKHVIQIAKAIIVEKRLRQRRQ